MELSVKSRNISPLIDVTSLTNHPVNVYCTYLAMVNSLTALPKEKSIVTTVFQSENGDLFEIQSIRV